MRIHPWVTCAAACTAMLAAPPMVVGRAAGGGTVERITVHGASLEGNLEGDSPDRTVMVYLPPSYKIDTSRRYPVVYLLHGFTDDTDHWWGVVPHFVSVPKAMDAALAGGAAKEMILVMPNAYTRYFGSMYGSSPATGDWEAFVANELVAYVDAHYRTIADASSRGLAGHSMGGYGTVRIGMKRPDVFSAIYAMSACCLSPGAAPDPEHGRQAEAVTSPDAVKDMDFLMKAMFASAAAWSPNPTNPPMFLDLPTKDGQPRPEVLAKWAANAPLAMIDQYIGRLRRLHAIAIDVGTKDWLLPGSTGLDAVLSSYGITHTFETYDGDHVSGVEQRLETKVFAFFSRQLRFPGSASHWRRPSRSVFRPRDSCPGRSPPGGSRGSWIASARIAPSSCTSVPAASGSPGQSMSTRSMPRRIDRGRPPTSAMWALEPSTSSSTIT